VATAGRLYDTSTLADAVAEFQAWHRHALVVRAAHLFATRRVNHAAARFTH
jgi:hypothetical protein